MMNALQLRSTQRAFSARPRQHCGGTLTLRPAARLARPVATFYSSGGQQEQQQQQSWNPVDVVKREQGLQSNKLPAPVRESVSSAVEQLRFRVTVGDVAARAGVKLKEADDALKALAYDSKATLEVGEQGDVVYTFPRDFQTAIRARSAWLSLQPVLRSFAQGAAYLARITFGTALFVSVVVVWLAIAAIMLSGRRDDDRRGGGSRGYYGDGGYGGMRLFFNLADLFTFWSPGYGSNNYRRVAEGEQLNFIESIFSFVWGDGDPNAEYDAKRWAALGRLIQSRGGVLTAEEMAPFLDPPEQAEPSQVGLYQDESFVLPALIRFGGEPEVDQDTGAILYRFPALQASGVTSEWVRDNGAASRQTSFRRPQQQQQQQQQREAAPVSYAAAQEQTYELTAASPTSVIGVVALGVFNLVGVLTLQGMLRDPHAAYALAEWGLGGVGALLPALQLYAATFFAIPVIRSLSNAWRNAAITARNGARQQASRLLQQAAGGRLKQKLQAARKEAATRTIRKDDVVFSTAKEAGQQMNEREMKDWDQQLSSSAQAFPRSQPLRDDPAPPPPPPFSAGGSSRSSGGNAAASRRRDFDGRWQ